MAMNSTDSDIDKLEALLSEVRGESQSFDRSDWAGWSDTLGEWVEAYPAFGAGRLLRAKASRDGRDLKSADRLAQAAVFASVPGRLFDLLFRAGIESEIAAFARAVEALEPELESAMKLRWHPEEPVVSRDDAAAETDLVPVSMESDEEASAVEVQNKPEGETGEGTGERPEAEEVIKTKFYVPAEGTLAREVVLGAIARSIEKEIDEVRSAAMEPTGEPNEDVPDGRAFKVDWSETRDSERPAETVDVVTLSPLARWAFERSRQTGFAESAESERPSKQVGVAAEHIENVLSSEEARPGEVSEGGLEQQAALIDLFIRNEPVISPVQADVERPAIKELAKESLVEDTSLITETMARIYAIQGQMGRARRAYKLLALKYPEKSVYFAAQSKKLGRKPADD
jgi:hypothetical protein